MFEHISSYRDRYFMFFLIAGIVAYTLFNGDSKDEETCVQQDMYGCMETN